MSKPDELVEEVGEKGMKTVVTDKNTGVTKTYEFTDEEIKESLALDKVKRAFIQENATEALKIQQAKVISASGIVARFPLRIAGTLAGKVYKGAVAIADQVAEGFKQA